MELQPKLLRVLQEHEFERLGSTRTQRVDVRMVAATNRNLEQMVGDKQFREDLYFRLNVFPILIPPLRERQGDIPLLAGHYMNKYAQRMNKRIETIPEEAMEALCRYSWPGNIRELQNSIERAVILTRGSVFQVQIKRSTIQSNPRHSGGHPGGRGARAYPGSLAGGRRGHGRTGWCSGPPGPQAHHSAV